MLKRPHRQLRFLAMIANVIAWVTMMSVHSWAQCDYGALEDSNASRIARAYRDAMRPRLSARGTAVYMDRVTSRSLVLMQSTVNPGERLNANDFNFDWEIGIDFSLMLRQWDDNGIEIRYLNLGDQHASAFQPTTPGSVRILSTPPVFVPGVESISARLKSETYSVEANYHFVIDDGLTYLAGIRYISLDDDLTTLFDAPLQTFSYDGLTRNDLYGVQIGFISSNVPPILYGCLFPSAVVKAGVYGNDAKHKGELTTDVANLGVDGSDGDVSLVLELGVSAELRISEHLSILGGYSALWVESVAIVTDQIPKSDFFNGVGGDFNGDAVFHGANLAIELRL